MAESKKASDGVKHIVDSNGDHHIGVEEDGVFVPFMSVDHVQFADRKEALSSDEAKAQHPISSSGESE